MNSFQIEIHYFPALHRHARALTDGPRVPMRRNRPIHPLPCYLRLPSRSTHHPIPLLDRQRRHLRRVRQSDQRSALSRREPTPALRDGQSRRHVQRHDRSEGTVRKGIREDQLSAGRVVVGVGGLCGVCAHQVLSGAGANIQGHC